MNTAGRRALSLLPASEYLSIPSSQLTDLAIVSQPLLRYNLMRRNPEFRPSISYYKSPQI